MNLEDLARDAADDANAAGRSMPIVPLERSRRRRVLLTVVPTIAAGALAWVVIALVAFPQTEAPPVISQVATTSTTVAEATSTTGPSPTSTTTVDTTTAPALNVGWISAGFLSVADQDGVVLTEYEASFSHGRPAAWDGGNGFVVVTDTGLEWHTPDGVVATGIPAGELVGVEATPMGTVVGLRDIGGTAVWYDLRTGEETTAPVDPLTTDGLTFTSDARVAFIDQPDWSDVPRGEGGEMLGEFELPELVILEDGVELVRIPVGSADRPYVRIDDFDKRRVIVVAQPLEPALPPMTAWIIDLECADCTQRIETEGPEWFDLTGFLPSEGTFQTPELP